MELDDVIPGTIMTYRERIELAVADKRGNFVITNEISDVNNAIAYATERIFFWKDWNENWKKEHKKMNTQKRFITSQSVSDVYASAVFKSLVSLITDKLVAERSSNHDESLNLFQELLWTYTGGSLLMLQSPKKTVLYCIRNVKKKDFVLGLYLEMKMKNENDSFIKEWIKKAA